MEELSALVSRLKAIAIEIEAIINNQPKKKKSKDEVLAMDEKSREEYQRKQLEEGEGEE